jgi:hypothetical protein
MQATLAPQPAKTMPDDDVWANLLADVLARPGGTGRSSDPLLNLLADVDEEGDILAQWRERSRARPLDIAASRSFGRLRNRWGALWLPTLKTG